MLNGSVYFGKNDKRLENMLIEESSFKSAKSVKAVTTLFILINLFSSVYLLKFYLKKFMSGAQLEFIE